jgi:hypothetical protein
MFEFSNVWHLPLLSDNRHVYKQLGELPSTLDRNKQWQDVDYHLAGDVHKKLVRLPIRYEAVYAS